MFTCVVAKDVRSRSERIDGVVIAYWYKEQRCAAENLPLEQGLKPVWQKESETDRIPPPSSAGTRMAPPSPMPTIGAPTFPFRPRNSWPIGRRWIAGLPITIPTNPWSASARIIHLNSSRQTGHNVGHHIYGRETKLIEGLSRIAIIRPPMIGITEPSGRVAICDTRERRHPVLPSTVTMLPCRRADVD